MLTKKKEATASCETEDLVETRLRGLYGFVQGVQSVHI